MKFHDLYQSLLFGSFVGFLALTILRPAGTFPLPIPNFGGIYLRSLALVAASAYIIERTFGNYLSFYWGLTFYSFHEVFINTPLLLLSNQVYGLIPRELGTLLVLFLAFRYGLINFKLSLPLILFILYEIYLYVVWPLSWFYGEGAIPISLIPQLQEFILQPLSILAFNSLFAFDYFSGSELK